MVDGHRRLQNNHESVKWKYALIRSVRVDVCSASVLCFIGRNKQNGQRYRLWFLCLSISSVWIYTNNLADLKSIDNFCMLFKRILTKSVYCEMLPLRCHPYTNNRIKGQKPISGLPAIVNLFSESLVNYYSQWVLLIRYMHFIMFTVYNHVYTYILLSLILQNTNSLFMAYVCLSLHCDFIILNLIFWCLSWWEVFTIYGRPYMPAISLLPFMHWF